MIDTKIQHLCACYEYWYFDTCSWMNENIDDFFEKAVDIFKAQGRKIILFDEVEKELLRHAAMRTKSSRENERVVWKADHALNIIDQLDFEGIILRIKTASSKYADRNIIESIIHILGDEKMVVVTSDRNLAKDIMTHIHGTWFTMNAQTVCIQYINKVGGLTNWATDNGVTNYRLNDTDDFTDKIGNYITEKFSFQAKKNRLKRVRGGKNNGQRFYSKRF